MKRKKEIRTMDVILVIIAVFLLMFIITLLVLYYITGAIPDTLCTCVFTICGGECGVMGWIKTTKERKRDRQYELDDRKHQEELEKEKTSIHIEKMSSIPYEILKLMDNIMQTGGKGDFLNDFTSLMDTIYAYGSKEAIKIAATMQKENYTLRNTVSFNKYRAISMYILLATQIKNDVTGIRVSPELWLEMKITDYANNKDEFKKANNDIVRELKLENSFCI